jgi:hypothetical protein
MLTAHPPQANGTRWKCLRRLAPGALLALGLCGCSSLSNTDRGVLGGGAIGAGTGAAIGSATGHTGAGAAIGGIVGAVSGGLIGNAVDESERKQEARQAAAAQHMLGLQDIANMTSRGVSESVIISQIRSTGSVYNLTADDIIWLKQNAVSDVVIQEMQASAARYPRRVYSAGAVYVVPEPPPPPPPVSVGFGLRFCR